MSSLFGNNPNYDPKPAPPLGGYGDLSPHDYYTRAHSSQLNNARKRKEAEIQQYTKDLDAWKQRNGGSRKRRNGTKRRSARKGKRSNRNKK